MTTVVRDARRTRPRRPRRRRTSLTALGRHLADPMRRSAYALILATGLTSALGLVFWALAARWLSTATVGIGAALISAMALLANLATLGLRNGLIRFLPTAGSASQRLILTSYALCAVAAMVAATLFLIGQPLWAARLDFLRDSPLAVLAFVVGTAFWVVFVLQDHVLVGLRRAAWVPVENGLCAVLKIALLPLLALTGGWAVFGAAVIPAAAAVLVVTALILSYLRRTTRDGVPVAIPVTQLVRFAAADHVAALLWMATADLLTLLVLNELGPEASAYYFLANTIGYTLYLVVSNVGSALVAEGAGRPEDTVRLARQAVWNAARLVLPLAVVGIMVAPLLLGVLGPDYAAEGTVVLQLLLLSALPQVLVGVAVAAARIRRDLRTVMGVYAALALGSLGGSWLTLGWLGLAGVGWSCLVTQLVVASVLLVTGRTGLFTETGVRGLLTELEGLPLRLRRRRSEREIGRRLDAALVACGLEPVGRGYVPLTSDSDALVVAVESGDRPVIVKIATSVAASDGLERHAAVVDLLRSRLDETTASVLPERVQRGLLDGHRVLVETRLPGTSAGAWPADPQIAAAAVAALSRIHRATASPRIVDDALLAGWVDRPLDDLRSLRGLPGGVGGLDRLRSLLHRALRDRELTTSCVHGDFWFGNVLVERRDASATVRASGASDTVAGAGIRVTGLVDWENGAADGLPDADLVHWWLAAQPVELGAAVRDALTAPGELPGRLAAAGIVLPNPQLPVEQVVLLTWLWHVTAGMSRTSADHLGRVWLGRNVKPVLQLVSDPSFGSTACGATAVTPSGPAPGRAS